MIRQVLVVNKGYEHRPNCQFLHHQLWYGMLFASISHGGGPFSSSFHIYGTKSVGVEVGLLGAGDTENIYLACSRDYY